MRKKSLLFSLPVMAMLGVGLLVPQEAEAQYHGGGYRMGGYGHQQRPQWGFRHRLHGYLGGHLGGFLVLAQINDYSGIDGYLGHGGGGGLHGGVRLNPFLSLELNWAINFHEDSISVQSPFETLYLMTFTGDAKVHIPTYGPVEPFFQGGIGFAYLGAMYQGVYGSQYDSALAKGPAFRLGGGIDIWLGPFFSVGGKILYQGLYFTSDSYGRNLPGGSKANFVNGLSFDAFGTFHF